jgi:hypothetical protein
VNVELTEAEIVILRGLDAKPALDIPGGIVDDNMSELIDIGYMRAALKRSGEEAAK